MARGLSQRAHTKVLETTMELVAERGIDKTSVDAIADAIQCACFVEVGPKNVLYNLFGRSWMPGLRVSTDKSEQWQDHLRSLAAELRNAA